ncbi:MAG TPA: hypothetical protein VFA68_11410 [Terriglobales bacterium]|nr:hypothetical protein [Terriglobales bacterium]
MRTLKLIIFALFTLSLTANAANVVFQVKPINLSNGWRVTGTITTDGTTGAVSSANIIAWNLKVVQTTDMVWTEKDSNALNISGVSSDGNRIFVSTSPDGIRDGGTLFFSRGGGGGGIATNAVIADFTQLSLNLGYGMGGIAGWQDEIGGLNYVGLNQKNHSRYRAGSLLAGQPNVFRVIVPVIATDPVLMTIFGTVTTDGTVGALNPANFLAWNITARNQLITYYTEANSTVLNAAGITSDGLTLNVAHQGGKFNIGISATRPTFVTLADFTDPTTPNGFANYYLGNYGVMGEKTPLVGNNAKQYTVAKQ